MLFGGQLPVLLVSFVDYFVLLPRIDHLVLLLVSSGLRYWYHQCLSIYPPVRGRLAKLGKSLPFPPPQCSHSRPGHNLASPVNASG